MIGIDSNTGKHISGLDHLRQSLRDILTTPLGSRVMRRDYGSRLFDLIDRPLNRATILQLYSATADAIRRWEPRLSVTRVRITNATPGAISLEITGRYLPSGKQVVIDDVAVP